MKITRNISSSNPHVCSMRVKGFFGGEKGRVEYDSHAFGTRGGYVMYINGVPVGAATDFYHACDALMADLGIIKNTFC